MKRLLSFPSNLFTANEKVLKKSEQKKTVDLGDAGGGRLSSGFLFLFCLCVFVCWERRVGPQKADVLFVSRRPSV